MRHPWPWWTNGSTYRDTRRIPQCQDAGQPSRASVEACRHSRDFVEACRGPRVEMVAAELADEVRVDVER